MKSLAIAASAALLAAGSAAAEPLDAIFNDVFPGVELLKETTREYDERAFITGPLDRAELGETLDLEGRLIVKTWQAPPERSTLEVFRAYETALENRGFTSIYACKNEPCGRVGYMYWTGPRSIQIPYYDKDQRLATFERVKDGARDVVTLFVSKKRTSDPTKEFVGIAIEALTTEAEMTQVVTLDADAIAQAIDATGSASIYGLEFETGSAALLPASAPVLEQMAAYLNRDGSADILLVGHTDNVGDLSMNMGLSKSRADAVKAALIADYGVPASRLDSHGVGYLAPKAANATDAGRQQNRRVEMVVR